MSYAKPDVIGRRAELDEGGRFLDAIADGPAGLVLVGEAGAGKTTLWRAIARRAMERSQRVLWCRPAASEARLSLGAIADLLAEVEDQAFCFLPTPQRHALEVALLRVEPDERPSDWRAVATALVSLLTGLARADRLLVAVDDVQWLDGASAHVLEFAARRLHDSQLGLLLAVRGDEELGVPLGLERAQLAGGLRRVGVGPLSLASLHQIIKSQLGQALSRSTLSRIADASGGNPFFALEIARSFERRGAPRPGEALRLPANLRQLVTERIAGLPAAAHEALLVAAATAAPTLEKVTAVAGSAGLAAAQDAGVVEIKRGRVCFTHPLLATGIYEAAAPARRREAHRRLAGAAGELEEQARHLALASDGLDEEVAGTLTLAARRARARGAPQAAAELLELAISAGSYDPARILEAADCHYHADNSARARALLQDALERLPAGAQRARALLLLAEVRYHDDSFPQAAALLERALGDAGDDAALLAAIEVALAFALVSAGDMAAANPHALAAQAIVAAHSGRVEETRATANEALAFALVSAGDMAAANPHAHAARAQAERTGDRGLLAQTLAVVVMCDFRLGRGLDQAGLERALALEDHERRCVVEMRPSLIAALLWMWTGAFEPARATHAALRRGILERGEERDLAYQAPYAVALECWRGDLAAAQRLAAEALEVSQLVDSAIGRGHALAAQAIVAAHSGRVEETRATANEALALFAEAGFAVGGIWPLSALAAIELALGDAAAVDRALGPLGEFFAEAGLREPMGAPFVTDKIEALIALDRLEDAETLLDQLEQAGHALARPWALAVAGRCRGLLLAARGELDTAIASVQRALAEHDRVAAPLDRARTLLALGQIQRRAKRRHDARATLDTALAIFDELGASLWAERTRAELRRLGTEPSHANGLTPSEQRVAELAATGITNREVASALFISPKTVEANLSRAYSKLGIHSRAQLGAWITAKTNGTEHEAV